MSFTLQSLPFALSIGPQRAATSWIDRYLRWRGDICLPAGVKETGFFDRSYGKGVDFYRAHFAPAPAHKLIMEVTTTAFDVPDAPRRVHETLGQGVRLLCPLRHPVMRSYSLYLHYCRYGQVRGNFYQAIKQMPQIIESSHYAHHLSRWYDQFGKDTIALLYQEELEQNQKSYVTRLCHALQIPYVAPASDIQARCNACVRHNRGWLAARAQKTADWLRAYRLYTPINVAKALGLKSFFFGGEDHRGGLRDIPQADIKILVDLTAREIERLEKLTGSPVPFWQEMKNYGV